MTLALLAGTLAATSCIGPVGSLALGRRADVADVTYTPPDWPVGIAGDIYRPPAADGLVPAVLMLHGDGRIGNDGRWQMAGLARKLARRGYLVFNITYRMAPDWMYPAPLDDARQAVKWMRENAAPLGIDPDRIGVFGYSSGGYVGSLAALTDDGAGIRAVVAGGSPSDLTYYSGGELMRNFLGGTNDDVPEQFHEASPVNHVTPHSPPFFLYHGERDTLVHPDHVREMVAELRANRVPHEVFWIRAKGHITAFMFPDGATDAAFAFLDRYLK